MESRRLRMVHLPPVGHTTSVEIRVDEGETLEFLLVYALDNLREDGRQAWFFLGELSIEVRSVPLVFLYMRGNEKE